MICRLSIGDSDRRFAQAGSEPFRDDRGLLEVGSGQNDGELLAAGAGREIDRADGVADDRREGPQHVVAELMPVAVVDRLEVVEVGDQERETASEPKQTAHLVLERLLEAPTVGELREVVGDGLERERPLETGVLERDRSLRGK